MKDYVGLWFFINWLSIIDYESEKLRNYLYQLFIPREMPEWLWHRL